MPNKEGHRRFGSVRKRESGRYQARYPGPDGRLRSAPDTFARKSDAERYLSLIEAQIVRGEWTDPDSGKQLLLDYAEEWIAQRPGLRPRTIELYSSLLRRHIAPQLGGIAIGKLTTPEVRSWRAKLLADGLSPTMTAKSYRLLRAVLATAVDEDKILTANPCRVKGAGREDAAERPVITVVQVFELAERIGLRPIGNIRQYGGQYRLRYLAQGGHMRPHDQHFATRADAERELWSLLLHGRAEGKYDSRYRALVLLATFASLRWGEVTALHRRDIDTRARTIHIRAAYTERSTGQMILGPPKSRAGLRTVTFPAAIVPDITEHRANYTGQGQDALVFTGVQGGPMRRSGFNRLTGWPYLVTDMGLPGLHVHDLRHTGNTLAADMGISLRNLMARMGHDNERAALIYQHKSIAADRKVADGLDELVKAAKHQDTDEELMAR